MMKEYPNFELIEFKCVETAYKCHKEILKNARFLKTRMDSFLQTWGSTALGFDAEGCCAGQAFTDAYTTVVELSWCVNFDDSKDRIYGVFFGNEIAYMFINPNEQFFEDLKNRNMRSQKDAMKEYV